MSTLGVDLSCSAIGKIEHVRTDPPLVRLLADTHDWVQQLREGRFASIRALARHRGHYHRPLARSLPLVLRAPDTVTAILAGRQPAGRTVSALKPIDELPIRWDELRTTVGFTRASRAGREPLTDTRMAR